MALALIAIFLLGIVTGLRAFTAVAVLWLMRQGGPWAIVLAVLAVAEFAGDLYPKTPARTSASGLIARIVVGGFVGWSLALISGIAGVEGAVVGVTGALVGTYGGLAARLKAIATIGPVPAALLEDALAVSIAVFAVSRTMP